MSPSRKNSDADATPFFARFLAACREHQPVRMAVVHPVDAASLGGAMAAARDHLAVPVLVGPGDRIRKTAETNAIDIAGVDIVSTPHSHAAGEQAVAMARAGHVDMLMKGALHTDELLAPALARETGLRTARRISHVFVMDVPNADRPYYITDAAINITPTLEDLRDIVQNAIDLAHALGNGEPRVAILSAVETVTSKLQSTLNAAALCKMADRGQITGAKLDGPLAFDNAVSPEAAAAKGIVSEVAGRADILVVPDLVSGNMLAKELDYLAGASSAGLVLGARVPIVLTSRADGIFERKVSTALAVLHRANAARVKPVSI